MSERPTPNPAPVGFKWEALQEDARWITPAIGAGRCRYMKGRKACGKPAAATLMRHAYSRGHDSQRPWDYCDDPEHLYGRWVEDGKVMHWRLVPAEDA